MKFIISILFLVVSISSLAQDAIVFDSIPDGQSFFTDDAIYVNSGKLFKADYSGNVIWTKEGLQYAAINVEGNSIYCYFRTQLIKLDTSGNFIWKKNLPTFVCP